MDSYRGILVRHEPSHAAAQGDAYGSGDCTASEDDIGREPPPAIVGQNERRMQVRAYNYWTSLLGHRQFPQIGELTSAAMPDFADHAVVLDFSQGAANPAVTMLGKKLAEECGLAKSITRLSDVPDGSLLSRIFDHCMQALASAAPIGFEAEFVNQRGMTLLYRGILLPFSRDGQDIHHLMGVINWKELADPVVTAELRHELEIATAIGPLPLSSPQLDAWADGPVDFEPSMAPPLASAAASLDPADWLAETLRRLPVLAMSDIGEEGCEFAVVLIRRPPGGRLGWLGEVGGDAGLIDRIAGHLLK